MNRLIFLIVLFISPAISAQVEFSPAGCEYSIRFPSAPEITKLFAPQIGEYEQASFFSGANGYFLRAECLSLVDSGTGANKEQNLRSILVNYALANGLKNVEYEFGFNNYGSYGRLRGNKNISGSMVTYAVLSYMGDNSYLSLYAGGESETYPHDDVYNFLFGQSLVDN
jgi:hypothetical protein